MARGPYYTTVTAIGHPVRTTMRSSSLDGVIGGILYMTFWFVVGAVVLSPIWVPIWIVNEMYKELHPVLATLLAAPFLLLVTALYLYLYFQYEAKKEEKAKPGQYDDITTVSQVMEVTTVDLVMEVKQMMEEYSSLPVTQTDEILTAPYPAEALRESILKQMEVFPFPKGSEDYDEEMRCNQYWLAKNVKLAMIEEWHETRKIHGIGYQTECVEEREAAVDKVIEELFGHLELDT